MLSTAIGEMTTVLLTIIGMILVGLFSRAMLVLATVFTLGFAAFAALLVWEIWQIFSGTAIFEAGGLQVS